MISKELLSAALEIEVTTVRDEIKSKANMLYFETTDLFTNRESSPYVPSINIYELAHKCKEWAFSVGFCISSANSYMDDGIPFAQAIGFDGCEYPYIEADEETEAIFKVCDWILKEIK